MSSQIIEEVNIDDTQADLVAFLIRYLPKHVDSLQYEWLYRQNPDGPARVWRVVEGSSGATIGAAAAFPRTVWVAGREVGCWNLGDFAMDQSHRSLGPAVKLQRACLAALQNSGVAFAYDHPSCNMMAIYRWMGVAAAGEVTRYALPLRVDDKVRGFVADGVVERTISAAGNTALRMLRRRSRTDSRMNVGKLDGRFDERATVLDRRLAGNHLVVGSRNAEYLNWRYLDNPATTYDVYAATETDRLLGYAVVARDGEGATLADLYFDPDTPAQENLVEHLIADLFAQGVATFSAPVLQETPLAKAFKQAGFRPREKVPFVVLPGDDPRIGPTVIDPSNWFYTNGDRDV